MLEVGFQHTSCQICVRVMQGNYADNTLFYIERLVLVHPDARRGHCVKRFRV